MIEASSTQPDSKESSEMVETASTQSSDSKEISGMVEGSSTQPDSKKSSEMVEGFPTQLNVREVSDEMVEAASTQPDGKESSDMVEGFSTQLNGKESTEMVEATSESVIETKKLQEEDPLQEEEDPLQEEEDLVQDCSQESSEIVKSASTEPDNEEICERVNALSTQPDNKENKMLQVARLDGQGINEIDEDASTQSDDKKVGDIIEAASAQLDGKESNEKATSTQSDIQIEIQKKRKKLAEEPEEEDSLQDQLEKSTKNLESERNVDLACFRSLVRAIFEKNVKVVKDLINKNRDALLAADSIDEIRSTILHLIVQVPGTNALLYELVSSLASSELLERRDVDGFTALHVAAAVGNKKAAERFVEINRKLLYLTDNNNTNLLPVDCAIAPGRYKETVEYLLSAHNADAEERSDEELPNYFAKVLDGLIAANHIDLALDFLNRHPKLADRRQNKDHWNDTLNELARKDMGLPPRTWQRLIYHYIPIKMAKHDSKYESGDIENQIQAFQKIKFFAKLPYKLWIAHLPLVPGIKRIHDQKLIHEQTLEMVRLMIGEVIWSFQEALQSLQKPMCTAVILGNHRFVKEILKAYPYFCLCPDEHGHTIFHLAVLYRQENVFNLIHNQTPFVKDRIWVTRDNTKCNILHLAGRLVPSNEIPGAALQMQRELQWFKAVEDICHPKLKNESDFDGKTPREVFTEAHKTLVKDGEKWMKETATACSVVAALIITVVFAAAYTFPGGINGEGLPNFLPKTSFKVFLFSIALALFSSTASVQMFLGILTSRYAEEDFLESLPTKLIIGLITLFFSITSMMVAFATTFHIYLQPWKWVPFAMAGLVFVPITLYPFMQFRLMVDIVKSTYRPSILRPMR